MLCPPGVLTACPTLRHFPMPSDAGEELHSPHSPFSCRGPQLSCSSGCPSLMLPTATSLATRGTAAPGPPAAPQGSPPVCSSMRYEH